jgi:hypothetical protein
MLRYPAQREFRLSPKATARISGHRDRRRRLHERGGKRHEMPAHHKLEQFIDEYLDAAGIRDQGKTPSSARRPAKPGS